MDWQLRRRACPSNANAGGGLKNRTRGFERLAVRWMRTYGDQRNEAIEKEMSKVRGVARTRNRFVPVRTIGSLKREISERLTKERRSSVVSLAMRAGR